MSTGKQDFRKRYDVGGQSSWIEASPELGMEKPVREIRPNQGRNLRDSDRGLSSNPVNLGIINSDSNPKISVNKIEVDKSTDEGGPTI